MINVATAATAAIVAIAGVVFVEQPGDVVEIPVTIGGILQICALGGIAVIWWLVRGAFNDMRAQIAANAKTLARLGNQIAYIEGSCAMCINNTKKRNPSNEKT